ncbi:MAG: SDR family oxidoreductase [Micromonosporaceae bacterium]|nr:SDR family oxidoreductase [Micromonosporaceae bacterium]
MGRRILITGGAGGLGLAMARRFARDGWRVLVADLDEAAGQAAAKEIGGAFHRCDVRSDADWAALRDWCEREWDGLDVLVNNAGVSGSGRIERIDMADWDWMLDINLKGVVRGCRTFVPMFKQQRSGHIVNVASMAGLMNLPGMVSYNVAKAGVVSLSETLRYELEPYGVRATAVCPSFVKTNIGGSMRSPDPVLAKLASRWIEGSKVTAEQVADQVFDAVRTGRFRVITHPEARAALRLKRFFPRIADRPIRRMWRKTTAALEKQDTAEKRPS